MSGAHDELIRAATEGDMEMVSRIFEATEALILGGDIPTNIRRAVGNPRSGMSLPPDVAVNASAEVILESSEARIIQLLDRINQQTSRTLVPGRPATFERNTPRNDAYDVLTQGMQDATLPSHLRGPRHGPRVRYDVGLSNRWPHPNMRPPYRRRREIPLSCQDACGCHQFDYEHAPHLIPANHNGGWMRMYREDHENAIRRQVFAHSDFGTTADRYLVEMRQGRALIGLDTSGYDVEIARRILADSEAWGPVGEAMRRRGWVDEVVVDGEDYVLH